MIIIIDILPFDISEFSRIFIESMNKEEITFKSQYFLQSLAKTDPGFTYNITHDSDNNVTGIDIISTFLYNCNIIYLIHFLLFVLMIIIIDILPFAITGFSRIFIESMNKEEITFKSQYLLQSLAKTDPGFTYNITHDSDNNVTGIV